jgi:peroxiredoxin
LVGPTGRIASRPAAGDSAIVELVDYVRKTKFENEAPIFVGDPDDRPANGFGKEIPEFKLRTSDGGGFSNSDMYGRFTLAVFWSLTCTHCIEMLDQLKSWRSNHNGLALAIFADGDEKKLRETGLDESLIFDSGYKVSEKMGMYGTPSAIIVDDKGRIISELVAGAERIRVLAGFE